MGPGTPTNLFPYTHTHSSPHPPLPQYADAIATASESGDGGLAEGLLTFFVGRGDKEAFAACLFTCSAIVRPDVAMELAWRHRMMDHAMPFLLQTLRDTTARVASLEARLKPADEDKSAVGAEEGMAGGYGGAYGQPVLQLTDAGAYGSAPPPPLGGMSAYGMGGMPGMGGAGMAYGGAPSYMPQQGMY